MVNEARKFPKINGDIYYAEDANASYYQAVLSSQANYGSASVTDTASLILSDNSTRKRVLIRNFSNDDVYIGADNTVDSTTGQVLNAGQSIVLNTDDAIYGISTGATVDIRYIEVL